MYNNLLPKWLHCNGSSSDVSCSVEFKDTPQSSSPSHIHSRGIHFLDDPHWNWECLQVGRPKNYY